MASVVGLVCAGKMTMLTLYGFEQPDQMALPGFEVEIAPVEILNRRTLGRLGEFTVWNALEASGYQVRRARMFQGDLRVIAPDGEIFNVEVKTARPGADGKWRACLYKRGCTDHKHADIVVLLAVCGVQAVPFVIPVKDLPGRSCVITSSPQRYAGRLAAYRQDAALRL
jgi:hypothetical protein